MQEVTEPQYRTPDGAALRMWRDAAPNKYQSERLGRALFDEVLLCEVITPGSKDSTPVFELERVFCAEMGHPEPLRGMKYAEYEQYIKDFQSQDDAKDTSLAGTPLSQWREMTRTMVASLKAASIFTLEALAHLPDTKLNVVGPDGRTWREKAKAYLASATGNSVATALAGEIEVLRNDIVAGQQREQAMAARIQELESTARSGGADAAKTTKTPKGADTSTASII